MKPCEIINNNWKTVGTLWNIEMRENLSKIEIRICMSEMSEKEKERERKYSIL